MSLFYAVTLKTMQGEMEVRIKSFNELIVTITDDSGQMLTANLYLSHFIDALVHLIANSATLDNRSKKKWAAKLTGEK